MGERGRTPDLDASRLQLAVVVARYNQDLSERLLQGALEAVRGHQGREPEVYWVPGALEIPVVAQSLAESGRVDAVICLGTVIRGETAHFEHVAGQCASGLMQVALETGTPCTFGVLTTFDRAQAEARADGSGNKGAEAAAAAIETANLLRELRGK